MNVPSSPLSRPWLLLARDLVRRHVPGTEVWHYDHALLVQAIDAVGLHERESDLAHHAQAYMEAVVSPAGRILEYRDDEFNLDQINPGKLVQILAARGAGPRWEACLPTLRHQLQHQPRTASGGFWHKKIYPHQMWLDGLYMQAPFLARWARETNEPEALDEVVRQLLLVESRTRDPETGLLYHAWDESRSQRWSHPETGCSPHFWSRAIGWYAMAVVDVLDWLPAAHPGTSAVKERLTALVEALAAYQHASGLWYQVTDQGDRPGNYLETSGTAMFAYAVFKAVNQGWLGQVYRPVAERAWTALVGRLRQDATGWHLDGTCSVAGLGGTPYRDGSFAYYVSEPIVADDNKGVGPFLLAGLEQDAS